MGSPITPSTAAELDTAAALRADAFAAKRAWHQDRAGISVRDKMEAMLHLQRAVLPILRARRPLLPHEKPWSIRP